MTDEITNEMNRLLGECDKIVDELQDNCCAPRRSPRMARLEQTLSETRQLLLTMDRGDEHAQATVDVIEDAGAQIGSLQVSCCAPSRMPLYDELLHNLMKAQRAVKQQARLEH